MVLGAFYCLTPFVVVHSIASVKNYFADHSITRRNEEKAIEIIRKQPPITINGLYVESISLRWALYQFLVDREFPFVEGDVANIKWLLDMLKDEQSIVTKSSGKKYYRLALGSSDGLNCISFKKEEDNPARGIPVQPETCVTLVFDNALSARV